jgi:hypothetical protein
MIKKLAFLALCCTSLCANDLTWGLPQILSIPGENATNPQIGMDAGGNLVAAWIENNIVMASTRPFEGSWTTPPTQVSHAGASSLELVVDQAGNATAIWNQSGVIQSASLPFRSVWSTPIALSLNGGTSKMASSPQISLDSSGNLAAIWVINGVIQVTTKQINKNWSYPNSISHNQLSSDSPQIAIGGHKNIVAVWHSTLNGTDVIYASSTTLGTSWPIFPPVISDMSVSSVQPQVAIDSHGTPLAVWYRYDRFGTDYSNVYVQTAFGNPGNVWNQPMDLSAPGKRNPKDLVLNVAFNQNDIPLAVWTNSYDSSTFNLEASRWMAGEWTPPVEILSSNVYLYNQDFVISPSGYAYGVYMASDLSSTLPVIRAFKANTNNMELNFGNILTISKNGSNIAPRVDGTSVDLAPTVGAIWLNYNGSNTVVQAAIGNGAATPAPVSLSVTQRSNNLGQISEYYNTLRWSSSPPDSTSSWVIFRNGLWLQTVPATVLQFIDYNAVQNQPVTYGVALQSHDGDMSPISMVSFP